MLCWPCLVKIHNWPTSWSRLPQYWMEEYKDCGLFLLILRLWAIEHDCPNLLLRLLSHPNPAKILLHPAVLFIEMVNDRPYKIGRTVRKRLVQPDLPDLRQPLLPLRLQLPPRHRVVSLRG